MTGRTDRVAAGDRLDGIIHATARRMNAKRFGQIPKILARMRWRKGVVPIGRLRPVRWHMNQLSGQNAGRGPEMARAGIVNAIRLLFLMPRGIRAAGRNSVG